MCSSKGTNVRANQTLVNLAHGMSNLIELKPGGNFVVYHVMPLGAYYRRQMEEENE